MKTRAHRSGIGDKLKCFAAVSAMVLACDLTLLWADDDAHKHDKKPAVPKTEVSKQKEKNHIHDHNGGKKQSPHKEGEKDHHDEGEPKDEHDHDHEKEKHKEDAGEEHGHGDEEEGGEKNVGPDKGVTSFDEEKGFTLSEEAKKTFSLEAQALKGSGPWVVPISALLLTGEETNIYRVRDGAFKRIDVDVVKKEDGQSTIRSSDLKIGDAVVVKGVGFIRIAEVDVTSGESGHHH